MNTVRQTVDQIRIGPGMLAFLITIFLAFAGGLWSLSMAINEMNSRLDRNLVEITRTQDKAQDGQNRICLAIKDLALVVKIHDLAAQAGRTIKRPSNIGVDC